MARVTYVKKAQARYKMVPDIDPATGQQKTIAVLKKDGTPKTTKHGRPIVRRLTVEDKTQPLPNRKCDKCGKEIEVGQPYKWVKPKSGPYGGTKRNRCAECPSWRPSDLTSSPALGILYAAQEAFEDDLGSWDREDADALKEIVTALAEGVREAGQQYQESADNMESGFGTETSISAEIREKGDTLESAADEIEALADEVEEFDADQVRAEVETDVLSEYLAEIGYPSDLSSVEEAEAFEYDTDADDAPSPFDAEEYEQKVQEALEAAREEWADAQVSTVEEAPDLAEV